MYIFGLKPKTIKLAGFVVLSFLLLSTAALAVYMNDSAYGRVTGFFEKIISPTENNLTLEFNSPQHFTYNVTKIDVMTRGAALSDPNTKANIINLAPLKIDTGSKLIGFREKAVKSRGTDITYQLTSDLKYWYYFNGKEWAPAGNCESCTNNQVEINQNIDKFPIKSDNLQIKSFLTNRSNAESQVILKSVEFKIAGGQGGLTKNEEDKLLFVRAALAGKDHDEKCGNGQIDSGEECDDGNNDNLDFCSNQCENQTPICHATGSETNPFNFLWVDNSAIDGQGANDHTHHPGDIIPITDINNNGVINEDDCNAAPRPCGNGTQEDGEECDDGNNQNGDGCSSLCKIDSCDGYCKANGYTQGQCRNSCSNDETREGDADNFCSSHKDCCCKNPVPQPTPNPPLTESCGLDIMLVLDSSDSIDNSELQEVRDAANGFVNALGGTPTKFGVVDFDTQIINSLNLTDDLSTVHSAINNIGHTGVTELTNWEAALTKGQQLFSGSNPGKPNLMVIVTDGDPTTYGYPTSQGSYGGAEPDAPDINNAIAAANSAKTAGTRILAIGVTADPTVSNLVAISGPSVNSGSVNTDVITTDFNQLFSDLAQYAIQLCGGTITVNKYINQIDPNSRGGQGWTYNLAGQTGTTDVNGQTQAVEVGSSGGPYSVTETSILTGYYFGSAICKNQSGAEVGTPAENGVGNISINDQDIISCSFVNSTDCGDGQTAGDEECDDGNNQNGDGCSAQCKREFCGDNALQEGLGEECDDGNNQNGDGCSAQCKREFCGDNALQEGLGEECDDGNNQNGDGCSAQCKNEYCGDNTTQEGLGEECDDGNNQNGDGCSSECKDEEEDKITICHYPPGNPENRQTIEIDENAWPAHQAHGDTLGPCPVCGNEILEEGEECDDGNTENGDGCDSICKIEQTCNSEIELIRNGGFESTVVTDPSNWDIFPDGTSGLNWRVNWESTQTSYNGSPRPETALLELQSTYSGWLPREGNQYAELDTDWDGPGGSLNGEPASVKIYQDIPTIPGETYTVKFSFSPRPGESASQNVLSLGWNGATQDSLSAIGGGNTNWTDYTYYFVATSETTRLDFSDAGIPNSYGTFLDNVSARCGILAPVCGNGSKEQGEECDDGNTENGDGCSATCQTEEVWDKSNIEVEGTCSEPNIIFTITNTGDPLIGDMEGPSEYRIYREGTLEVTGNFQLNGGENLQVVFENAQGENITIQADQRPGHPGEPYAETSVDDCAECICNGGISEIMVRYLGQQNGVTINVYAEQSHTPLIMTFPHVQFGNVLKVSGSGLPAGKLDNETYFEIVDSGIPDETIPTSCNDDIVDKTFGNFYVVNYTDKHDNFCGQTVSQGPIAVDDNVLTPYNTPVDISILANDYDPDGGGLDLDSVTIDTPPLHGIAVYNSATGIVTYTPTNGFTGIDTFTYTVCDLDDHLCDTATVTIGVGAEKFPPIANDDTASTPAGTPVDISILDNDADLDGTINPATVLITALPANGNLSVNPATGVVTYTPNPGFTGTDTFNYKVKDNDGLWSNVATVTVKVGGQQGEAKDDSATTCRNVAVTIKVVANDTGNFDPPAALSVTINPSHGMISSIDLGTGSIKYTPTAGYLGNDSFEYEVCDNTEFCDKATVSITVKTCGGGGSQSPPLAVDDSASTPINTPVTIDIAGNDSDPDGNLDKNSVILISPFALHGTVSIVGNGVVTYTPNPGFTGTDIFYYQIFDTTGLFSSAKVTVNVTSGGGGGEPLPPVAVDDAATTSVNTPVTIQILSNDYDPDGTLVPSTAQVITGQEPEHGTVQIVNGVATYTPNPGFIGIDEFQYQVCDNDGLCASAKVMIVVPNPITAPICGNGIIEGGEECDDGNTIGGDGCSLACTFEPPTPTLIIPPLVLTPTPPPPPSPADIRIFGQFCGQVYATSNVTFAGSVDLPIGRVGLLEYSLNNGLSWNNIYLYTSSGAGTTLFNFTLSEINSGSYAVVVRATATNGDILATVPCPFTVKCALAIGANQFILSASQSPMSSTGVIQFEVGKPQKFYLEAQCASLGLIKNDSTQKEYPLTYNTNLKLWTANLLFDQPGTYSLEALIANDLGESYSRKINTVFVSGNLAVSDASTGLPINQAAATVFAKDPATGKFNEWQGSTFQRDNPFAIPQGLSIVLPRGEYYINVTAPGYNSIDSLIANITQQSVVTATIRLVPRESTLERLFRLNSPGGIAENFPLDVAPLPAETLLPIGKIMPDISAVASNGRTVTFSLDNNDRPTVILVYNNWNTEAQEQLDIFKNTVVSLRTKYRIITLTTMEPFNMNLTQNERGDYGLEFYKPTNRFFDNFMITSLPQLFVVSGQGELLGTVNGSLPQSSLLKAIDDIANF